MGRGKVRAETQVDNRSCSNPGEGHFIQADGTITMFADLDLGGNRVINVDTPVDGADAVNKDYVDDAIASITLPTIPTESIEYFDVSGLGDDTYVLADTPDPGTERVYLNGVLLRPGAANDYTIAGDTVTMQRVVKAQDVVAVEYAFG